MVTTTSLGILIVLEQRFGRIHRIGQTELPPWNLVLPMKPVKVKSIQNLLRKLEEARNALGGRVFDVLGKVQFDGKLCEMLLY